MLMVRQVPRMGIPEDLPASDLPTATSHDPQVSVNEQKYIEPCSTSSTIRSPGSCVVLAQGVRLHPYLGPTDGGNESPGHCLWCSWSSPCGCCCTSLSSSRSARRGRCRNCSLRSKHSGQVQGRQAAPGAGATEAPERADSTRSWAASLCSPRLLCSSVCTTCCGRSTGPDMEWVLRARSAVNRTIPNYFFGVDDVDSFLNARLFGAPISATVVESGAALRGLRERGDLGLGLPNVWNLRTSRIPLMIIASLATHFNARFGRTPEREQRRRAPSGHDHEQVAP